MTDAPPPLVLASASPRRTGLLSMLGIPHEVLPTHVEERLHPGEDPSEHVARLASDKALAGHRARPGALVLAADTIVVLDGEILDKPADAEAAARTLLRLAGRAHAVHTALALVAPDGRLHARTETTRVRFRPFDEAFARAYAATGEPLDKAGAYGIQGRGAALVERIEGEYHTVVGLPVAGLLALLADAGWRYTFGGLEPIPTLPHPEAP